MKMTRSSIIATMLLLLVTSHLFAQSRFGLPDHPPGLVSWWTGDGTGNDMMGANHGTVFKGVRFEEGVRKEGFSFDGTIGRINVPDSPSLMLTHSLTIECWLFVNALPDGRNDVGWSMIFFRGDNRPGLDPYFLALRPDGSIYFHIQNGAGNAEEISATIPTEQFIHAAAVLDDDSGRMQLFFNGLLVAQKFTAIRPLGALDPSASPGIGIGNHGGYPETHFQMPFNGIIDELRIYDRALSQDEIQKIASAKPK